MIHKSLLYYKIVHNLTPSYLVDLLPTRVCERTQLSLRSALNFTIFPARTERFKLSFSPSTTKEWNNINAQLKSRDSIGTFKRELSIHTCKRLDACALNYYSYRIAVEFSPVCLCGQSIEDISHFFSSLCCKFCPEN